ncbi:MAG: TetR/AcrR family transcriptional regulator [Holophagales bacterium]|jgi:AcrR family transcriptional regulator|nr:TetR/AcrR family transcriptional regulator [Holophagales bacterium]
MSERYKKKKQPEDVRRQLLDSAAQVTIERGLGNLTLDLVAQKAGVSKGGLIHHFPSRQALVTSLFHSLLEIFQKHIESFIEQDSDRRGRFTRAYVKTTALPQSESKLLGAFALAMSNDEELARLWFDWLKSQIEKHGENTLSLVGRMVRYAADGIWLENCTGGNLNTLQERQDIVEYLINLTYSL